MPSRSLHRWARIGATSIDTRANAVGLLAGVGIASFHEAAMACQAGAPSPRSPVHLIPRRPTPYLFDGQTGSDPVRPASEGARLRAPQPGMLPLDSRFCQRTLSNYSTGRVWTGDGCNSLVPPCQSDHRRGGTPAETCEWEMYKSLDFCHPCLHTPAGVLPGVTAASGRRPKRP